jgi:hypothetical protein
VIARILIPIFSTFSKSFLTKKTLHFDVRKIFLSQNLAVK